MGLTISDLPAATTPYDPQTLLETSVPDGSGGYVSKKALLNSLVGHIPVVEPTTVAVAAETITILLPSGFSSFRLVISNMTMSANTFPGAAFSTDGGNTWINDTLNGDSYASQGYNQLGSNSTFNVLTNASVGVDGLMRLSGIKAASMQHNITADIFPGSATYAGTLIASDVGIQESNNAVDMSTQYGMVNVSATVPVTIGPVNALLLLPYGNGDVPPTSGATIAPGTTYAVWGVPG